MDLHDSAPETPEGASSVVTDDLEAPEADAVEQGTVVHGTEDVLAPTTPDEVNPADYAEQQRVVSLEEDDYR
jgi:hypothetical protein